MRYVISIVFINFLLLTAPPVYADDDGGAVLRAGVHAAFHELERQMIYKYFKGHVYEPVVYEERGGPPKKKGLPPGIQKKLARGGTLAARQRKKYFPEW